MRNSLAQSERSSDSPCRRRQIRSDNNQSGQLAAAGGDASALERRELGDAADLVDTVLGYLLDDRFQAVSGHWQSATV